MVNSRRSRSTSHHVWRTHFTRWQSSGLSKAAYCRQHQLNAGNFYNWCHRFSKATTCEPISDYPRNDLIAVSLVDPPTQFASGAATVSRAGTTVELPVGINAEQLRLWLAAIHTLHG